jgi:hypothetical protein
MAAAYRQVALTAIALAAVGGGGHVLAWEADFKICLNLVFVSSLAGILLLFADSFSRWRSPAAIRREQLAVPAVFAYALVLFLANAPRMITGAPLLCADRSRGWGEFIALLVPLVIAGTVFPRWGEWLAAAGVLLFLFESTVALGYNISHGLSGVGYWTGWGWTDR